MSDLNRIALAISREIERQCVISRPGTHRISPKDLYSVELYGIFDIMAIAAVVMGEMSTKHMDPPPRREGPPEGWSPSYPGDQSWRGKGYNPGSGYDG